MPEVCRFYGIIIKMFFNEHLPPHFHVEYSGFEAIIEIDNLSLIAGNLPPRALGLVIEWASSHQKDLLLAWQNMKEQRPPSKIDPLN